MSMNGVSAASALSASQSPLLIARPIEASSQASVDERRRDAERQRAGRPPPAVSPAAKSTSPRKHATASERFAHLSRARSAAADVPALMRFKRLLAESENSLHAVRATAADWLRDGFGAQPGFTAFVVEAGYSRGLVGMATCSQRIITGWSGPVIFLQDLFVEPAYRRTELRERCSRGWPPMRMTSAARSSSFPCAPTIPRSFLPAKRISSAAALPDLRAGGAGARRTRGRRRGRSPARRLAHDPFE